MVIKGQFPSNGTEKAFNVDVYNNALERQQYEVLAPSVRAAFNQVIESFHKGEAPKHEIAIPEDMDLRCIVIYTGKLANRSPTATPALILQEVSQVAELSQALSR